MTSFAWSKMYLTELFLIKDHLAAVVSWPTNNGDLSQNKKREEKPMNCTFQTPQKSTFCSGALIVIEPDQLDLKRDANLC